MNRGSVIRGMGLCAGVGGLELGLGFEPACFIEREGYAQRILLERFPGVPLWDDLETFDGRPWRGRIDILSAGFPCQPWSVAGKQKGTEDERWLWPEVARVVRDVQPPLVFLENVPGLLAPGGFECVLADLAREGFDAEWGLYRASEAGASHERERLFVLAWTLPDTLRDALRESTERRSALEAERGHAVARDVASGLADPARDGRGEGSPTLRVGLPESRDGGASGSVAHTAHGLESQEPGRHGAGELAPGPRASRGDGCRGDSARARWSEPLAQGGGASPRVWPPGPSDREGWAQVIESRPDLEPAVRRVAHGIPHRMDRIKCLGNAVVPAQADLAFCDLARRGLRR